MLLPKDVGVILAWLGNNSILQGRADFKGRGSLTGLCGNSISELLYTPSEKFRGMHYSKGS